MNKENLQKLSSNIHSHLTNFRRIQAESEENYQKVLGTIADSELRAAFMEKRIICIQRQNEFIGRLEKLHEEIQSQISRKYSM